MRGVRGRDVRAVLAALATAVLAPMGLAQISATPAEAAVPTYGPGNPSFAAYYANPSSMATWAAFCSGAGDGASYSGVNALGVPACGPTPTDTRVNIDLGPTGTTFTPDFQCVEFAERYLWVNYGFAPLSGTDGDQVVAHYAQAHSLAIVANGSGQLPQVGAVMSFASSSAFNDPNHDGGHVAVVTAVTSTSVTVVGENQNGTNPYTDGVANMSVTGNDAITSFSSLHSIEWFNPPPPSGGGTSGRSSGSPSAGVDAAGNQFAFWKSATQGLSERWYGAGRWSGPVTLTTAGPIGSAPAIAVHATGEQDVFWTGTNGVLSELWRSGRTWNGPATIGPTAAGAAPAVGVDGAGDQFVFWRGSDDGLWERWYSGGPWNGPARITVAGAIGSAPAVAVQASGDQDVFWSSSGSLWETWYSGGRWKGPVNLGTASFSATPSITAGVDAIGEQFVFWQSATGGLWEKWYAGGTWNGPTKVVGAGTIGSGPSVAVHASGEQDVFWTNGDGSQSEYWHAGGRWNGPINLSMAPVPDVTCGTLIDGGSASPQPATVAPLVSTDGLGPIDAYSDAEGTVRVLAPAGWTCPAWVSADGSTVADVLPPGGGGEMGDVGTFTNGIEGYRIPGCVGCMFDLLCAVFPSSSLSQVPLFQSYTCFTPSPTGETDTQVSADVVKFQDPPGVTGSWGRLHGPSTLYGLMYLYVDPVYGPTAGQVVCSLPASDAALCHTVLNDFAARYTRG